MSSKVVTGNVRFSYLTVFKPRAFAEGSPEQYSVVLLIPKDQTKTIRKIKKAIDEEIREGMASFWKGKKPANLWNPLRDGDDEKADEHPEYEGMYFLTAKSTQKPILLDEDGEELFDQSEMYSGCWGRADITFFAFDNKTKGVGVGLNALKKTKDDKPFGNAMTVESAKKSFEEDEDEEDW